MNWHYAVGKEQRGPLPEEEIRELLAAGAVSPDTLVWRAGMSQWRPARETELSGVATSPTELHRCIITGKLYPTSQIITTSDGPVSHEGKDFYYQARREGAPLPLADGIGNARADGKYIVVPIERAVLPLRCIKTNTPVSAAEAKSRTLYWCPPLLVLTILLNLLIFLILYLIFRKRVKLDIPLSAAGRRQLRKHAAIAWTLVLVAVAAFATAIVAVDLLWLVIPALVLLIAGMAYGVLKASKLRIAKLRQGEAWLAGGSAEFLASLPRYI